MSDRDDEQRRFMTPPKEWGDASDPSEDTMDDDRDWLGGTPDPGPSTTLDSPDDNDGAVVWPSPTETDDNVKTPQDGAAVWLDHAETDDYVNTPHDEGRAAVKHDDEYVFEADQDEDPFEPESNADDVEPDILTDHQIVPQPPKSRSSLWPALTVGVALILLVIGGWGAISERSQLTARIAELETAGSREQRRGDMSGDEEKMLKAENVSLSTQLSELREQYSSLTLQLSELETALASSLADTQRASLSEEPLAESAPVKAAATDATSQPGASARKAGNWFVNVAAYSQASAAQSWVDKLSASFSQEVVSSPIVVNGKTLHRVRISGLADREAAQALAKTLENTYSIGPLWVGRAEASATDEVNANRQSAPTPSSAQRYESSKLGKAIAGKTETLASGATTPDQTPGKPVELRSFSSKGGWFIYVDTFSQGSDADAKAQTITEAGFDAKVAVEYRSGELFYRVQVVGITSREEGETIAEALSALGDMPNLQLRQY